MFSPFVVIHIPLINVKELIKFNQNIVFMYKKKKKIKFLL